MRIPIRHLTVLAALSLCFSLLSPTTPRAQTPAPAEAGPLTVMSFNIRLGTANDGDNHWSRRRTMLFDVIRADNPDLIGVQEAFRFQIDEILAAVPGYAVVGVGRDDGLAGGETSAILFRAARLHVSEAGTFWFSDTPDEPGTRTWGNRYNRISSWARLIDRDGTAFYHYNLHLDHESQPSREKSTELLLQRMRSRTFPEDPVVVTGDFNVGEDNPALLTLVQPQAGAAAPALVDTFRRVHPAATEVGTFTGFTYGETMGPKIDYVLVEPGTQVLDAAINRTSRDNRYPSDHFPVTATIRWAGR